MGVLKKWKCQWPFFCNSAITTHFHWEGLKVWRTFRKNWLKAQLAWSQLLAFSEDTWWILTLRGSAEGSKLAAHLRSQGSFWFNGFQQLSCWSQLVVKEAKSSRAVLKVKVKNSKERFSAVPSKLASILSLKMVWRRFSLLLNREKYWQFWASRRQSGAKAVGGLGGVGLDLSFK